METPTPSQIIEFLLDEDPEMKQAFTDRRLKDVFSDKDFKPGPVKLHRTYFDEDGEITQFRITPCFKDVWQLEYNGGYLVYVNTDDFDTWQLQRNRNTLLDWLTPDAAGPK